MSRDKGTGVSAGEADGLFRVASADGKAHSETPPAKWPEKRWRGNFRSKTDIKTYQIFKNGRLTSTRMVVVLGGGKELAWSRRDLRGARLSAGSQVWPFSGCASGDRRSSVHKHDQHTLEEQPHIFRQCFHFHCNVQ